MVTVQCGIRTRDYGFDATNRTLKKKKNQGSFDLWPNALTNCTNLAPFLLCRACESYMLQPNFKIVVTVVTLVCVLCRELFVWRQSRHRAYQRGLHLRDHAGPLLLQHPLCHRNMLCYLCRSQTECRRWVSVIRIIFIVVIIIFAVFILFVIIFVTVFIIIFIFAVVFIVVIIVTPSCKDVGLYKISS
jgi:hypothetical protein